MDVVVAGSRCRGIEQENSDLDVVVEYTGSTREDDLFNMLHEDSIYIAGIQVDINPITEGTAGKGQYTACNTRAGTGTDRADGTGK